MIEFTGLGLVSVSGTTNLELKQTQHSNVLHTATDLRVVLKWKVAGSGPVITDVIRLMENPIGLRESIFDILNEEQIELLRTANLASCFLVDPDSRSRHPVPITKTVDLKSSDLQLLTKLLLDVESWFFARKRCLPKNTAVIKIQSASQNATLHIGMNCCDWLLVGCKLRAGGFFDPVRNDIQGILKRAFPDFASPSPRSMWKQGAIRELKLKVDEIAG